jgi:hypothetical protein
MRALVTALLLTVPTGPLAAQFAVEGFLGSALSAHTDLSIRQAGFPDLVLNARYETRPLDDAPYYALRLSHWFGRWGVLVEDLHHKLYLANTTPQVRRFNVTYGYNLLGLGPMYRMGEWALVGAAGMIVTNPSNIVRGQKVNHEGGILGLGYYVDGVHLSAGINRRVHLGSRVFLTADLRLSAGWAEVKVVDGSADVPNLALHALVGAGFGKRRR